MTLGKKITRLREAKGLTEEELAEKLGVDLRTILTWERGRGVPSPKHIKPMSEILDVPFEELELSGGKRQKIVAIVLTVLAVLVFARFSPYFQKPDAVDEYNIFWGQKGAETLSLGEQEGEFPWGTDLEGEHSFYVLDDNSQFHTLLTQGLEADFVREIHTGVETVMAFRIKSADYKTKRGVKVGDFHKNVVDVYGDHLKKRSSSDLSAESFCAYDYVYTFDEEGKDGIITFFILGDVVEGIELTLK